MKKLEIIENHKEKREFEYPIENIKNLAQLIYQTRDLMNHRFIAVKRLNHEKASITWSWSNGSKDEQILILETNDKDLVYILHPNESAILISPIPAMFQIEWEIRKLRGWLFRKHVKYIYDTFDIEESGYASPHEKETCAMAKKAVQRYINKKTDWWINDSNISR